MADDVKKLLLQIDATTELLKRNLAQGDNHVARFERDTKRRLNSIDRSFAGMGRGLDVVNQKVSAFRGLLAAAGVAFGVAQIGQFTRQSFELASALAETSQQLGVSTRALQVYRYIGGQVGIEQETMDRSLGKLNKTLGEAALGAERPTRALRGFGFTLAEIRRGLTVEQVIPRLADGLSRVESSSRRAAVETLFFGRAGQQLDTMLTMGGARINELADAADRLGLVLSDEQIARLDEAADKYEALKTLLSARIAALVADNADAILGLVDALGELISKASLAADAWRSFRLETEAGQIQNRLNAGSTPPEWGMGGSGQALSPQERMQLLERLSEIRGQQLEISRRQDPNYRPPATPRPPRRNGTADPEIDGLAGGSSSSSTQTRTPEQAFNDFEAALRRRGIHRNRGRTGFRTRQDQAEIFANSPPGDAAPPGSSDHEFWRAMDLPPDVDWGVVSEAAREAGVNLNDPLVHGRGNNRHTHTSWSGHGRPGEGGRAGGEASALREQFQFDSELRRAQQAVLNAQRDLATDYSERASLAVDVLNLEREQEFAALDLSVQLGERTQVQADQLKHEYMIADGLRRQAIIAEEEAQRREEDERLQAVSAELQRSLLEGEADLATTQAERRRVELRILELAYQEERARLQRIIDLGRGDADEEEARRRLAALPEQHEQQREGVIRSTRGPLEEYLASLPRTAEELNEALEDVAANGLQSLNDGIVEAIMGAKSLGDVFKNVAKQIIADLLRIAVQRAIITPLANAIFGALGGATNGGGKGASFGGPRAIGGGVSPNRVYAVGERGIEYFQPSVPGQIIPNHAIGGGEAGRPIFKFDLRGAVVTQDLVRQMNAIGEVAAEKGGAMGSLDAQATITRRASRQLPAGG